MNNYLYHHGVKGQRWGVRRYQNPDGSLTAEGKKKYDQNDSTHKYDKYKDLGLSKEDQFTAQYRSDKLKKAAIISGSVVLTAAAVYAGKRFVQNNIDTVVKKGMKMQTIMAVDKIDNGRQFYTALNGLDKLRYNAIAGQMGMGGNDVYKHVMEANKNFKIASNNSAHKVFSKLASGDKEFKNAVETIINNARPLANLDPYHGKEIKKAYNEIQKGKIGKHTYNIFNVQLAAGGANEKVKSRFFDEMKKAGYSGIKDVNDMNFTNYASINPLIIFDGQKTIGNVKVSKVSDKEFKKGLRIVQTQGIYKRMLLPTAAQILPVVAAKKVIDNRDEPEMVSNYRKQHPNSKKTYNEIVKMLK